MPAGAYGLSAPSSPTQILADEAADLVDIGGVGGTLAGNALSVAAMRATLEHVLTEDAFAGDDRARRPGTRPASAGVIEDLGLPWNVVPARRPGRVPLLPGAAAQRRRVPRRRRPELDDYLHLYLANRGILLTPFHNMALMCPATTDADVDGARRGVRRGGR